MSSENLARSEVDWARAKEIFTDIVEGPPAERSRMLERAARHDRRLREVVARLLASHDGATEFLDETPGGHGDAAAGVEPPPSPSGQ